MEYKALAVKALELFADQSQYIQSRGGRLTLLRDEYPHVYKMPFILAYDRWPTAGQQDYDWVKVWLQSCTLDTSTLCHYRKCRHDE